MSSSSEETLSYPESPPQRFKGPVPKSPRTESDRLMESRSKPANRHPQDSWDSLGKQSISTVAPTIVAPPIRSTNVKNLFNKLKKEHLSTQIFELYSDQYWTKVTSEGFSIYEKIYLEISRTGERDGLVSLYEFAKHFDGVEPRLNIHEVWFRLDLISKKAPRNYILAALYMLHMAKTDCHPTESPTITRDGRLTPNRLFIIGRFGTWVPCQCGNLSKVGFMVMSSRKKGQNASCGAVCCFPDGSNMIWRWQNEPGQHCNGFSDKNVRSENFKTWQKSATEESLPG